MIEIGFLSLSFDTWWIGWLIISVVGLIILGACDYDSFDGDTFGAAFGFIALSALWPAVLIIVAFCAVVAVPIYFGKYARKGISYLKKQKREKIRNMNAFEKAIKTKEMD